MINGLIGNEELDRLTPEQLFSISRTKRILKHRNKRLMKRPRPRVSIVEDSSKQERCVSEESSSSCTNSLDTIGQGSAQGQNEEQSSGQSTRSPETSHCSSAYDKAEQNCPHQDHYSFVRVNIKYKSETGRAKVLQLAKKVYHDFGEFNDTLSVLIQASCIPLLSADPSIVYAAANDGHIEYLGRGAFLSPDDAALIGRCEGLTCGTKRLCNTFEEDQDSIKFFKSTMDGNTNPLERLDLKLFP